MVEIAMNNGDVYTFDVKYNRIKGYIEMYDSIRMIDVNGKIVEVITSKIKSFRMVGTEAKK